MHWLPWWAYPAACCFLAGGACGALVAYPAGYFHRELVELGNRWARLLAWKRRHRGRGPLRGLGAAYRELFADIGFLCATGHLRPKRCDWRGVWR